MQIQSSPSGPAGTGQATAPAERPASQIKAASSATATAAGEVARKTDSATDAEQIKRAAAEINRQLKNAAQSIRFTVDEALGKTIVRVVDSETGRDPSDPVRGGTRHQPFDRSTARRASASASLR